DRYLAGKLYANAKSIAQAVRPKELQNDELSHKMWQASSLAAASWIAGIWDAQQLYNIWSVDNEGDAQKIAAESVDQQEADDEEDVLGEQQPSFFGSRTAASPMDLESEEQLEGDKKVPPPADVVAVKLFSAQSSKKARNERLREDEITTISAGVSCDAQMITRNGPIQNAFVETVNPRTPIAYFRKGLLALPQSQERQVLSSTSAAHPHRDPQQGSEIISQMAPEEGEFAQSLRESEGSIRVDQQGHQTWNLQKTMPYFDYLVKTLTDAAAKKYQTTTSGSGSSCVSCHAAAVSFMQRPKRKANLLTEGLPVLSPAFPPAALNMPGFHQALSLSSDHLPTLAHRG
ncbi:unnamed protein product, partial [Amoebophrya sp. A25]